MRPSRAVAFALTLSMASPALAQPASPHESAATAAYDRGDLATALREFEAAYADTARPELLYVIGKLYAARGDCTRAVDHFNRFLASNPGPNATEGARAEISKCETSAPAGDTTAADTLSTSTSASAGDAAAGGETPRSPSLATARHPRDRVAMILMASGVTIDLLGLLLYTQARGAQCGPVCTGIDYDEYREKEDKASTLRLASLGFAAAGTGLLGFGVWSYLKHRRERRVEVGVVPTADGGAVVLGGSF